MTNPMKAMHCKECGENIPVEELPDGSVLIHCPKCVGECVACNCYLAANCFDQAVRVEVRQPTTGSENTRRETKN